ncbi:uncharacterized protein [Ptychodera flava]|uniref:uncharacterized protein n=1 Tax=Ptychodera flava TaxID=63121 RepID=UPI003969BD0C
MSTRGGKPIPYRANWLFKQRDQNRRAIEKGQPPDRIEVLENRTENDTKTPQNQDLSDRGFYFGGTTLSTGSVRSDDHSVNRSRHSRSLAIFTDANKQALMAVGKNFMLNTTAHGVPRLAASKNFHKRLLWFIIICGSMTAFIVQTYFLVDTFLKYRVTNKITLVTKTSLTFPTVTVCNTNKLRRSAIADSPYKDVLLIDDSTTLPYYGPCMEGDFMCDDGLLCIKPFLKCDGVRNCLADGSDELGCEYGTCGSEHFRCANGSQYGFCIEKQLYCDRKKDCYEGEDEIGCECKRDEFQCADKSACIAKKLRCNVHFDCNDGSDENDCPTKDCGDAIWCVADGYCIHSDFKCDGYRDCSDGQDESNCTVEIPRVCNDGMFRCADGICIPQYWKCDSVEDCVDGSDESLDICGPLPVIDCPFGFSCDLGNTCLWSYQLCDKMEDCRDGQDESSELCDVDCDEFISEPNRTITSLGYPNEYPDRLTCTITIDNRNLGIGSIYLYFSDFDLEGEYNDTTCRYDYVQYEDGTTRRKSHKMCGPTLPSSWTSDSTLVTVTFKSDFSDGGRGFLLNYNTTVTNNGTLLCSSCGCEFTSPSGNFTSPGYPDNLHRNIDCNITLSIEDGSIQITFLNIESNEDQSSKCSQDWFQITDDISQRTTSKLCSAENITEWISDSNNVTVSIHTGSSGQALVKFLAAYEALPSLNTTMPCYGYSCDHGQKCLSNAQICDGQQDCDDRGDETNCPVVPIYTTTYVTKRMGVLVSPGYPANYPSNIYRNYQLVMSMDGMTNVLIELTFEDFDIELSENCTNDWLQLLLYNDKDENFLTTERACGKKRPDPFTIEFFRLELTFVSNSNITAKGFRLKYKKVEPQKPENSSKCDADDFKCGDESCISHYKVCNTIIDCPDGSDEHGNCSRQGHGNESIFNDGWYHQFIDITQDTELFKDFRESQYRDPRFDRVKGEDPPDWQGFMTFSSTPDFSDLEDVLKLDKEEIQKYGHQLEDFVLQCVFNGHPCNITQQFVTFQHDVYGNCFKFNHGRIGQPLLNATNAGYSSGLILTLFMEQPEYLSLYGRDVGARVTITPHDIISHPATEGFTIMPGTRTSIAVSEERIVRLGGLYGNCHKEEDGQNSLYGPFYRYDVQSCKNLCLHSTIVDKCDCSQTINMDSVSPCSVLNKTQDLCQQLVTYLYRAGAISCGCEKTCEDINYQLVPALSIWPSKVYLKHLLRALHSTNEKTRDINDLESASLNLANLAIYFDELTYQEIREEPAYPIQNLFSDIGGSLGLYIGLSIITVFEFFEFVLETLRVCFRKDNGRKHS